MTNLKFRIEQWLVGLLVDPILEKQRTQLERILESQREMLATLSKDSDDEYMVLATKLADMRKVIETIQNKQDSLQMVMIQQSVELHNVNERLDFQCTLRQFEATSFSVERLLRESEYNAALSDDARIADCMKWARNYFSLNGWEQPQDHQLQALVVAKLQQVRERKVGPTQ